jgi:tetratricopeptide (TPR) repeat protein
MRAIRIAVATVVVLASLAGIWRFCILPYGCNLRATIFDAAARASEQGDRGARAYVRDHLAEAIECTRVNPREPANWVVVGSYYVSVGQLDDALATYQRALEWDRRPETYANIAMIYAKTGRWNEAVSTLELAARFNPDILKMTHDAALRSAVETRLATRPSR